MQFSRREIRYRTLLWKGLSLQALLTFCGISWDFYQREDFEEKAKEVWIAKKKNQAHSEHCSGNN